MASSSHLLGIDHLKFIRNSPYFFKIILQDTIQNGKLGIPRKFVRNHGNCMSSPAMLRVPSSGAVWKVELTKCDGKIWLEKGLLEFANHHSVDIGHLLVFRYDGNSNFHVIIFDKSASEIQYPYTSDNHRPSDENPEQIVDNSKDVESINILENISPSRKGRERSPPPCPRPHKSMSTNSTIKTECRWNSEFLDQQVSHNGSPARKGDKSTSHNTIQQFEKFNALERARNFKPENPFFLVVMQPSHVGLGCSKNYSLNIPANFVKEHLTKDLCSVILCNSNGKTWIATFKQRYSRNTLKSYLQSGWSTFVRDNNIQLGDVCAFELINSIEISFKVLIYKGQHVICHQPSTSTNVFRSVKRKPLSNASQRCPEPLTALERAKAFQKASAFKSENPFFVVVLHPSYAHGTKLNIPVEFARKYLGKMHKEVILLLSNGKSWPVKYYQEGPNPNMMFRKGWPKFAVDNDLEVGDACVFELIKGAETSMKVTIYKKQAVEDANLGSSLDDKSREKQVELHERLVIKTETAWTKEKGDMFNVQNLCRRMSELNIKDNNNELAGEILDDILLSKNSSTGKALKEASQSYQSLEQNEANNTVGQFEKVKALDRACYAFKSENPFFLVVMRPSYVGQDPSKHYRLVIPLIFVKKHLMQVKEHCSVTLCSSGGKTWFSTFKKRRYGNQLCSLLQNGWGTFVQDNNIQVGDVCAFELINSIEISFKVLIYKGQHANCHHSLTSTDVFRSVKRKPLSNASRRYPKRLTALEKAKAFQNSSAFESENPFFVIVVHPSYVHGTAPSIPANFARQYMTKMHKGVILILSNGKSWPVTCYREGSDPNLIFRKGWPKFAADNNLEVGDACVFELIKGTETSMKVTIYKKQAVEDAILSSSLDDKSRETQVEDLK